jgi:hypothetical protein
MGYPNAYKNVRFDAERAGMVGSAMFPIVAINVLDRQSISANHGSDTELTDHRRNAR